MSPLVLAALGALVLAGKVNGQLSALETECYGLAPGIDLTRLRGIESTTSSTQFFFLFCGALVFFMQAGFALLEAGSVQKAVVVNILFKNLADIFVGAIAWFSLGYAFAYGYNGDGPLPEDQNDFIGNSGYFLQYIGLCEYAFFFYQWTFAATTVTIVSGAMAGRTQLKAYLVYAIILTAFVYPTVVKWTWSYNGWLWQGTNTDGTKVFEADEDDMGYRDFAGSGIVHSCGGIAALVGAWMVGPRVGWSPDTPIPGHSMPLVFLGTMILMFGFIGFNGGSVLAMDSATNTATAALAIVNTVLSAAGGAIAADLLDRTFTKKWSMVTMCNGALGGMVAICSCADSVWPWASIFIGMFGGLGFKAMSKLVKKMGVDDAIDAVAVHLGGGIVGVLLRPFFDKSQGLIYGHSIGWTMLGWNVAGLVVILVWTTSIMFALFLALSKLGWLRISDHEQAGPGGIDAKEHGEDSYSLNDFNPTANPKTTQVSPVD